MSFQITFWQRPSLASKMNIKIICDIGYNNSVMFINWQQNPGTLIGCPAEIRAGTDIRIELLIQYCYSGEL